jgi:hypothetical protein
LRDDDLTTADVRFCSEQLLQRLPKAFTSRVAFEREVCFDPSWKIQEAQCDFFVCRLHHGSTSAKTTNFTGNVKCVLTEVAGSLSQWCY